MASSAFAVVKRGAFPTHRFVLSGHVEDGTDLDAKTVALFMVPQDCRLVKAEFRFATGPGELFTMQLKAARGGVARASGDTITEVSTDLDTLVVDTPYALDLDTAGNHLQIEGGSLIAVQGSNVVTPQVALGLTVSCTFETARHRVNDAGATEDIPD